VLSVAGSASAVLETRAYDPYGQPLASTGTPQTPFGFTGELADANGLLYLRARHYAPRLGAFPSLDPYEGSAARPMSLNGYSWVEGRVADGRDPSGRCSFNASSTYSQRNQCSDAINQYIRLIQQQYGPQMNWPSDLRALVERELRYWNSISYSDFMREWNSSRPPASTNSSNGMGQDLVFAGGVAAMVDGPLPFGDTAAAILIIAGLCVAGLAALASSGAIALPMRPEFDFADPQSPSSVEDIYAIHEAFYSEPRPSRGGRKFDLAFGKSPDVLAFAVSFGIQPITLPWLSWPDWMISNFRIADRAVFQLALDAVLAIYFSEIPEGKLKLNLSGLDSSRPNSLTTFEVRKLSTEYAHKTEYFSFENLVRIQLSEAEAALQVSRILSAV
jgi:RHS repeat-associated protein